MISCACGLRLHGYIFSNSNLEVLSFAQLSIICGVTLEVAQVSITSISPSNSVDPHLHFPLGFIDNGSIGRSFSSATIILEHFLQLHTGKGTPKCLCLDMHQSHCNPSIQCSYLNLMCSGYHFIFFPASMNFCLFSNIFTNHCFVVKNSISVPHLSCTFTLCFIGFLFNNNLLFSKSFNISFLASFIFNP